MKHPDDGGLYRRFWFPRSPEEMPGAAKHRWQYRLALDMRTVINELETRRFLAKVVYRVPESLLDDVIRVRLADLTR